MLVYQKEDCAPGHSDSIVERQVQLHEAQLFCIVAHCQIFKNQGKKSRYNNSESFVFTTFWHEN